MATTLDINEELILEVLTSKKNALFSFNEEEQKQVVQEFVDRTIILPSKSIDDFEAEVTYKFFEGKNSSTTGKNHDQVGRGFTWWRRSVSGQNHDRERFISIQRLPKTL